MSSGCSGQIVLCQGHGKHGVSPGGCAWGAAWWARQRKHAGSGKERGLAKAITQALVGGLAHTHTKGVMLGWLQGDSDMPAKTPGKDET